MHWFLFFKYDPFDTPVLQFWYMVCFSQAAGHCYFNRLHFFLSPYFSPRGDCHLVVTAQHPLMSMGYKCPGSPVCIHGTFIIYPWNIFSWKVWQYTGLAIKTWNSSYLTKKILTEFSQKNTFYLYIVWKFNTLKIHSCLYLWLI